MGVDTSRSVISTPTSGFNRHLWIGSWPNSQVILVSKQSSNSHCFASSNQLWYYRTVKAIMKRPWTFPVGAGFLGHFLSKSPLKNLVIHPLVIHPGGVILYSWPTSWPVGKLERLTTECPPSFFIGFSCRFSEHNQSVDQHASNINPIFIQHYTMK